MRGLEKLREKLPKYKGRRIALIPILFIVSVTVGVCIQILFDVASRMLPTIPLMFDLEPVLPILGSCVVSAMGLILISGLWRNKKALKERLGNLAYQRVIPRGVVGVTFVFALAIHSYVSVRSVSPVAPVNPLTIELSRSVLSMFGVTTEIDIVVRVMVGVFIFLLGFASAMRALLDFGLDYMLVLYLYFPEESEVQTHKIYSVIRHPAYFALILVGLGAFFLRLSVYSLAFFLIVYVTLRIHIRVEEKELVERFGEGYLDYMSKVPGLYVRPRDIGSYLRYLRGG